MKSIKPGRGPSFIGGIASIIASLFGLFWTIMAISMAAPFLFWVFGLLFICLGIIQAIYNFKNATAAHRYSLLDITTDDEEPDPLNIVIKKNINNEKTNYCSACGQKINLSDVYCRKCGKKL